MNSLTRFFVVVVSTYFLIGCTVLYLSNSSGNSINTRGLDSESANSVNSEVSNLKDEVNNLNKDVNKIDKDVNKIDSNLGKIGVEQDSIQNVIQTIKQ